MEHRRLAYLGLRRMPPELSDFELAMFFTFSSRERLLINARRGPFDRIALALHIGFVRLTGATLDAYQCGCSKAAAHSHNVKADTRQLSVCYAVWDSELSSLVNALRTSDDRRYRFSADLRLYVEWLISNGELP